MKWSVTVAGREPGRLAELVPDAMLCRVGDHASGEWKSSVERACFTLPLADFKNGLPAGWYAIDGCLISRDKVATTPCLYPTYMGGADGDAQIPLPDPGAGGRIRAIVLLKYDVAGLRFCPSQSPAQVKLSDFKLRQVSRPVALWRMLGSTSRTSGGLISRAARFVVRALRGDVSKATEALYQDYRKRLLPENAGDYANWVERFDTLTAERMEELRARADRFGPDAPLISILLPIYQTPEKWLRRCIESVTSQVYPHWQLCIVDDASPDPRLMRVVEDYASKDKRIDFVRRSLNGHISEASNSALLLATGDFVGLLDHDDELRPHALLEMAEAIVAEPLLELLYSDEDKIDADGRRFAPYFKPDWNPDLLLSQNYVCHFTVIRTALVRAVGGFRMGFEGSQDHDLILRCTERLEDKQIHHVPRVLYHWRAIEGSTALTRDAKDYASTAGKRAVAEYLQRTDRDAMVEELPHGHYRVRWNVPLPAPKVSIIVPTRDRVELLRDCVESVHARTDYPNFEIIVVDNQSVEPETLAYLDELRMREGFRVLIHDAPFNYSAINNRAVEQCDGVLLCLLNNDIEVDDPGWLSEMVGHALRPEVGAVGAMLYYPDRTIQHAGVVLGLGGVANHLYSHRPAGYAGHGARALVTQDLSAVTGACLVVRRDAFEQVGGLDTRLQVAFNDIDFCLRLREAGLRNIWTPFSTLYHHESASRGEEDTASKQERFVSEVEYMQWRWGDVLYRDPAYNRNLSLDGVDSSLAFPPRSP